MCGDRRASGQWWKWWTPLALIATATIGVLVLSRSGASAGSGGAAPFRSAEVGRVASIQVGGVPTNVEVTRDGVWVSTALGGIVRVDPTTNEPVARIRPNGAVTAVASGLGAVWAIELLGDRLLRIDPATHRVLRTIPTGRMPSGLAVGHGLVWVASQLDSTVAGIDPRSGDVVKLARFAPGELWPGGLAVGPEGVWVLTGAGQEVSLFDPATMRFRHRIPITGARTVVTAAGGAWVGRADGRPMVRIRGGRASGRSATVDSDGYGPRLAMGGLVWAAAGRQLAAVDPRTGGIVHRIALPAGSDPAAIAASGDMVWTADARHARLLRIDLSDRTRVKSRPHHAIRKLRGDR